MNNKYINKKYYWKSNSGIKIKTIYTYKSYSINLKRNECKGKGKIDIKNILIEKCKDKINHRNITYEEFSEIMEKNDINIIKF